MKIKDLFKELLAICVLVPLLHNFCNADNVFNSIVGSQQIYAVSSANLNNSSYVNLFNYNSPNTNGDMFTGAGTYCISITSTSPQTLTMGFANGPTTAPSNLYTLYNDQYGNFICLYGNKSYLNAKLNSSSNSVDVIIFNLQQLLETDIPNGATIHITDGTYLGDLTVISGNTIYVINQEIEEIQTYGNNIAFRMRPCEECEQCQSCPIIDQEYCENNFNLISPSNCPVCSGGVSNWSSLWINNIQHLGASSIYMSIPEEISWDYSYSNSGEIMEVDVEGYNVDYDYINGVVNIQKYKPSSEDFSNIVLNLGLYLKILLFLVFAFILIKRIKKPFSSKLK